jgi:hypothetical protein
MFNGQGHNLLASEVKVYPTVGLQGYDVSLPPESEVALREIRTDSEKPTSLSLQIYGFRQKARRMWRRRKRRPSTPIVCVHRRRLRQSGHFLHSANPSRQSAPSGRLSRHSTHPISDCSQSPEVFRCATGSRVIVGKPFGEDVGSANEGIGHRSAVG